MAKKFMNNYDDLLRDMKANNITFSDYDLELAKKNPDAGRSLYTQKLAYGQATTDEERQKANNAANLIRQQYGGYSGGTDGTGFTLSQTYAPPASEYVSQYQDKINDWTDKLTNRGPYDSQYQSQIDELLAQVMGRDPYNSKFQGQIDSLNQQIQNRDPYSSQFQGQIDSLNQQIQNRDPYQSQYQGDIDSLLNQIMNREAFSYNPAADASYQAYSEKYRNAGNQAMQNALGSAAAMSGGQLSSYALTSAQQAQNNYAAQMSDMIPQLQQLAYEMYQNEGADMRNNLSTLLNQDDRAYNRYMDEGDTLRQNLASLLSQDELAYGRYQDEGNNLRQNLSSLLSQDEMAYGRYQDDGDRMYQNLSALIGEDDRAYGRYMDQIGIDQSILSALMEQDNTAYNRHQNSQNDELNRWQMNYGVNRDMLADQRYEDEKKLEQERYDQSLALDQEDRDYNRALDKAQTLGSAGNFDAFRALGYSDEEIQSLANAYRTEQARKYSSSVKTEKPYVSPYAKMKELGIRTEGEAYAYLVSNGFSDTEAGNMIGAYMQSLEAADTPDVNDPAIVNKFRDSVNALGIGPITAEETLKLADAGALVENKDGTVAWAPGFNASNYIQKLNDNALSGSTLNKILKGW